MVHLYLAGKHMQQPLVLHEGLPGYLAAHQLNVEVLHGPCKLKEPGMRGVAAQSPVTA